MIDDTVYTLDNGIDMQYIDGGVMYMLNGFALEITGEGDHGEIATENGCIGYYTRDEDGVVWAEIDDGRKLRIGEGEEEFAEFAKQMLS